jgi:hypothetical protein
LIKQAKDFERLGVAVKAALPQDLVDKAELELDLLPYADATRISDDGELALDETADPEDKAA